MIIKICGLRDPANIREVAAIPGVSLTGLIFYAKSPRYVDSTETAVAVADLKHSGNVGVFVNEEPEIVAGKCAAYQLDYIQLHGNERPEYLVSLKKSIPLATKLIKAFSVRSGEDLQQTSVYEGLCEYFLFDSPTGGHGGSGQTFEWKILRSYAGSTPFLLSGGIGPESIVPLGNFHHAMWTGVDLNSRFETAPGMKDVALISGFVQQFKSLFP